MAAERLPRRDAPAAELSADARAGRLCARCGATVPWRVQRFCMDLRSRFGGRVYCMACQRGFPAA